MVRNPFKFGEPVFGDFFTDRYREREWLLTELTAGHHVMLVGARQVGKSSLARTVMSELERRGFMTVYLELERAYSPARLIEIYLSELLRAAFRQAKELRQFIEEMHPELKQQLLLKIEKNGELVLDVNENTDIAQLASMVLDLSQHTADYKKKNCVVCVDEISQSGNLPDPLRKRFFEIARGHLGVGYLLVSLEEGKKREAEGFVKLNLEPIEERYLHPFIKTRFENTGFRIEESVIGEITRVTENHPNFTQMLCHQLWGQVHSSKVITSQSVGMGVEAILDMQSEFYASQWRDLSMHQKNLLLAICHGGGKKIFSQEYIGQHGLGNFSTVQKSLGRLLDRQILERRSESYRVRDLLFTRWLQRRKL